MLGILLKSVSSNGPLLTGAVAQALTIYKSLNENNKGRSFDRKENDDDFNQKPLDLLDLTQGVVPTSTTSGNELTDGMGSSNKKSNE